MGKTAFIFPGQGAQSVGMGADVYEKYTRARDVGMMTVGDFYYPSEATGSDSILVLQVHTGFGGLFVEKVFLRKNFNLFVGGMLGGGKITVTPRWDTGAFESVFHISKEEESRAEANYAGVELHTGFTVTLLPWLHVGTDVNGLFLMSVNGFGETGNSFINVNPGLRLRLVFGNLG